MAPSPELVKVHCWECRRRRLVCDSTKPACMRCVTAQVDCPGYGKTKPLRWRNPVQVSTYSKHQSIVQRPKDGAKAGVVRRVGATDGSRQPTDTTLPLDSFFSQLEPLKVEDLKLVQVMQYFNSQVFPNYTPILQLIPRLQIFELPLSDIHESPPCTNNVVACWALGHRINQMPQDVRPSILSSAWSTYYSHRGNVIRSLTEGVGESDQIRRAASLVHLALFLLVEVEHGNPQWRLHLTGFGEMIRGLLGLERWIQLPLLDRVMHHIVNLNIFGNATSHYGDQIEIVPYATMLLIVSRHYDSTLSCNIIFPPSLMVAMVHINHFRSRALGDSTEDQVVAPTLGELLRDINNFSATEWALSIGSVADDVKSLGCIYQSTVALYFILSLQSASRIDKNPEMEIQKAMHYEKLISLLRSAVLSPSIRMAVFWPFSVAGVAAVNYSAADRAFISEQLVQYRMFLGQTPPIILLGVLERFWSSGSRDWDDCYDQPYCFAA